MSSIKSSLFLAALVICSVFIVGVSAESYSDCSVYGNCGNQASVSIGSVDNNTISVNNSQYLNGLPSSSFVQYSGATSSLNFNENNITNVGTLQTGNLNISVAMFLNNITNLSDIDYFTANKIYATQRFNISNRYAFDSNGKKVAFGLSDSSSSQLRYDYSKSLNAVTGAFLIGEETYFYQGAVFYGGAANYNYIMKTSARNITELIWSAYAPYTNSRNDTFTKILNNGIQIGQWNDTPCTLR